MELGFGDFGIGEGKCWKICEFGSFGVVGIWFFGFFLENLGSRDWGIWGCEVWGFLEFFLG